MSSLREELEAIWQERKAISPAIVVDVARDEAHPLHTRFEWNDTEAGERFRLIQAAALIRSVRVIYKTDESTGEESRRRAYVSTGLPTRPSEYLPTDEALANPLTYQLVLRSFERAILALKRQYGHLKEYEAMVQALALDRVEDDAA
jgi:hypothetical protein